LLSLQTVYGYMQIPLEVISGSPRASAKDASASALMSQWVVHRDPRYHRDPQKFDPDRWTAEYEKRMLRFAYFPFGGGPRQCIGAGFAMTEARLVRAAVARRFRMELVPGQRVEPYASITLRPNEGIRMILAARSRGS
jgi:cytochrome P450